MEVDLHSAQHRLVATSTGSRQSSSYQLASGPSETTPSPDQKSQSSQKHQQPQQQPPVAGRTHRRSLSKCTTSSFEASSITLTAVDALLNASYELDPVEDHRHHHGTTRSSAVDQPMPDTRVGSSRQKPSSSTFDAPAHGGQPTGAPGVTSPIHDHDAVLAVKAGHTVKGSSVVHGEDSTSTSSHKSAATAVTYAQYLLQPACDFSEEITGKI